MGATSLTHSAREYFEKLALQKRLRLLQPPVSPAHRAQRVKTSLMVMILSNLF